MTSSANPELWSFSKLEKRPFDVVGIGECSLDTVNVVSAIPGPGGKAEILRTFRAPGGQVATTLLACSRLGLRCAYLGSVGDDDAGEKVLGPLDDGSIDLSGVRRIPDAATRSALILVEQGGGARAVLCQRDPSLTLTHHDFRREDVLRGRLLYLDAADLELASWAAGVAREHSVPVVLDVDAPAPGVERLLTQVDFPIVSREFAEAHFGTQSSSDALRGLLALGARFAVVTLGERGAVGGDGQTEVTSPAFSVEVRDTTGAGDVFHGAFVWALLDGLDAESSLRAANAAAAMNCRAFGAQGGLATRETLQAFMEEQADGGTG